LYYNGIYKNLSVTYLFLSKIYENVLWWQFWRMR
jgi:hypothetical protein